MNMQGIGASPGIALGRAHVKESSFEIKKSTVKAVDQEIAKYEKALDKSREQLEEVVTDIETRVGKDEAEIFRAHILLLDDPEMKTAVLEMIKNEKQNAEWSLHVTAEKFAAVLDNLEDNYLKERAADIRDVALRVIRNMLGIGEIDHYDLDEPAIIVARDLTPSDTAKMPRDVIIGFITEKGNETAHAAIMARALGIPAIVGCGDGALSDMKSGDTVVMDGESGIFHVNPGSGEIASFEEKKKICDAKKVAAEIYHGQKTVTTDGKEFKIFCNIGNPHDLTAVYEYDGEGVGLYRTEFLYMGRTSLPDENEQFQAYKQVAEGMSGKPVVIRTLDVGGDKDIPYLDLPKEDNPFLGLRGIRFCLNSEEIFLTQLKAILRAAHYGNIRIMFPMVTSRTEIIRAKAFLAKAAEELRKRSVEHCSTLPVGIMIEVPAAALTTDLLAKEVDFFSIGMNDLIQYTVAADRMNEKVSQYYSPFHPALLRLLKSIINDAHHAGKEVAMCGEAARDPLLIPLLVGMGLDEFSVSPSSVLEVREQINGLSRREMIILCDEVLALYDLESVIRHLKKRIN